VIEKFDLNKQRWEEYDELNSNRAKFSLVGLSNGNILIMGGKKVYLNIYYNIFIDFFFLKRK
jgi:hypothetical protein